MRLLRLHMHARDSRQPEMKTVSRHGETFLATATQRGRLRAKEPGAGDSFHIILPVSPRRRTAIRCHPPPRCRIPLPPPGIHLRIIRRAVTLMRSASWRSRAPCRQTVRIRFHQLHATCRSPAVELQRRSIYLLLVVSKGLVLVGGEKEMSTTALTEPVLQSVHHGFCNEA
ncbi:unnamed protein product [Pleuronectes platessa]|uniref:Uncharacterized protein n=1 Tax=Pleuronectes platessa TaxID=8262 RepID=A0A9N7VWL5_PLEPL|nr:unnamed protein product [Pleuronectes platessa]